MNQIAKESEREVSLNDMGLGELEQEMLRKLYPKAPESALVELGALCSRMQLDLFTKQAMLVCRKTKQGDQWTVQLSIDALRAVADRTGTYVPGREPLFRYDEKGKLRSATVFIKKLVAGQWHEFSGVAMISEFRAQFLWDRMPHVMLAKCAEAAALRKGWPHHLRRVYIPEEMCQANERAHAPRQPQKQLSAQLPESGEFFDRVVGYAEEAPENDVRRHVLASVLLGLHEEQDLTESAAVCALEAAGGMPPRRMNRIQLANAWRLVVEEGVR